MMALFERVLPVLESVQFDQNLWVEAWCFLQVENFLACGAALTLATPNRDSMRTPTLFGAAQPSQFGASMTPGGGCASPHQVSVVEMTRAFERAQQAENKARALKDMCEALEHQNKTYQSVRSPYRTAYRSMAVRTCNQPF